MIALIASLVLGVAAAASAPTLADNIDALFLAAQQAEDVGDCVDAGDRYTAVLTLAPGLEASARARVETLAKARLFRTAACRAACTVSSSDASLFATAKIAHANSEPKRTGELCAQLLQGKDLRCRGYLAACRGLLGQLVGFILQLLLLKFAERTSGSRGQLRWRWSGCSWRWRRARWTAT